MKKIIFLAVSLIFTTITFGQNTYPWTATGNIGIGTASPRSILDVSNKVAIGTSCPTTGSGLELYHYPSTNTSYVTSYNRSTSTYLPLYFSGSIFYFANGKIGIGKSDPTYKFELHENNTRAIIGYNANYSGMSLALVNSSTATGTQLGFGVAESDYKNSNGEYYIKKNWAAIYGNNITDGLLITADLNDYIYGGICIMNGGNVGIGTSNPTVKLDVNGNIRAERIDIIVDVPASDFVFQKDYKLLNLKDLETFVQTNKHLPEVPSAEEFKANGYSVGQMDDVLLRKVEELTLYIIEQQKMIEELKSKVENLEIK